MRSSKKFRVSSRPLEISYSLIACVGDSTEFLKQLNEPLKKESIEVLHQLQNSEIGSCDHFEEKYPAVLPLELYLVLEKRRKENREKQL